MISSWAVCVKNGKYHAEKMPGDFTREDLESEGWDIIGYVAFHKAEDAITYCKQMGFKPRPKRRKLVKRSL